MAALLVAYPLWWALGLGVFIFIILAVPMAWHLIRLPRVRMPPGFIIWVLFLVWSVASLVMLGTNPVGTQPNTASSRLLPTGLRLLEYAAVTVLLLFLGNVSLERLSQQRLVRYLGVIFFWTVTGGVLAVLLPTFQFTSPLELVLPSHLRNNLFVQSLVHPALAQLHDVLGYTSPRPAAPFGYTNMWGNNLAILLIWFVVGAVALRSLRLRLVALAVVVASLVPTVYSLNRGLWIALLLSGLYLAFRLIAQGRLWVIGVLTGVVVVTYAVVALSPLQQLIAARLEHGKSNDTRTFTTVEVLRIARDSPILGYGDTRNALGSYQSVAVGKNANCPRCGNIALGSNGQLWLVLVSSGFVGVALYVGFFLHAVWHYRRDRTAIGVGGLLAVGLPLFFMFVYNAMVSPLALYMISVVLLWRNEQLHDAARAEDTGQGGERRPPAPLRR